MLWVYEYVITHCVNTSLIFCFFLHVVKYKLSIANLTIKVCMCCFFVCVWFVEWCVCVCDGVFMRGVGVLYRCKVHTYLYRFYVTNM